MVQGGASIGKFIGWIYLDFIWQDMYEASLSRVQHIRSMIPTSAGLVSGRIARTLPEYQTKYRVQSRVIICAYVLGVANLISQCMGHEIFS